MTRARANKMDIFERHLFRDAVIFRHTGQVIRYGRVAVTDFDVEIHRTERGCIEWPWARSAFGYAILAVPGETEIVSRQILRAVDGEPPMPPEGQRILACHHCDNPPCIEPSHLYWGTEADNGGDRARRNRSANTVGEANGHALLTEEQVHEIDALLAAGVSQIKIAGKYGIAQTAVSAILSRRNWSHVKPRVQLPEPRVRKRGR